jgi:hypothetical protein
MWRANESREARMNQLAIETQMIQLGDAPDRDDGWQRE